jgi:hypothetical protein
MKIFHEVRNGGRAAVNYSAKEKAAWRSIVGLREVARSVGYNAVGNLAVGVTQSPSSVRSRTDRARSTVVGLP